jgi:amino acid adenylation domain-containing protein
MEERSLLAQRLNELPAEKRELLRKMLEEKSGGGKNIVRRAPGARVPLSFSQQRLWIVDQFLEGRAAYNQTNTIRLRTPIDPDAFRRAIQEIVRRHEILRTTFPVLDGEPYQEVSASLTVDIPLIDLRHVEPERREAEALRMIADDAAVPFDLATGPLICAALYRLGPSDHLFALTLHHIVCDGWSMGLFALELSVLYASFVLGRPSPFPELSVQYGDYAVWQRRHFSGDRLNAQLEYWRGQLAGVRNLDLPSDHPRPPQFTFRGARAPIVIEGAFFHALTALAEQHNTTMHVLLLAAMFALAHRYTGEDDLAIGTPAAGRTRREVDLLIGFFVNTQVIRANLADDPPFVDLLHRVRELCFAAFANQDVPFERLVDELCPVRDPSRSPLVQVMFQVFQPPAAPGVQREHVFPFTAAEVGTSKVDVAFELTWHPHEIRGFAEYNTDLFTAARMERLVAHYLRLLASIVEAPSRKVSELELLAQGERQLLEQWNATDAPYPRDSNLIEQFRGAAARHASRTAVAFGGATQTYAELAARAEAVTAALLAHGVGSGHAVGLLMTRCLDLPAAMIGILGTGAFYVPLDPRYPEEYLAHQLDDSGAKVVVTAAAEGPASARPQISIEQLQPATDAPPRANIAATNNAWLLYTSGTTGKPKGVPITHRNALRLVHGFETVVTPDDRVLQFAPVTFDASVLEIWIALLNGATVVLHPPDVPSLEELGTFMREQRISWTFLTTSLFRQMIEYRAADLRGVRELYTGGEIMPPAIMRAAWKALPRTRLVHAYGPTETTTFATLYPVRNLEEGETSIPIGRPLHNTTIHILDGHGNNAPIGIPGEIHIGGDGVAAGYWNRADLTARSFVPDPADPTRLLYRTGDLGRYRADGNIEFLGRKDRQVKVNGFRIELGELEAALASHSDVAAAAALLLEADGEKRLAVFAELAPGGTADAAALRAHLATLLPPHMLPSHIETLERFPLNANGKIDLRALAKRGVPAERDGNAFVEPSTALEQLLASMWKDLLHVPRVGVTDDFFLLGGHSLVATRLLSRIRETLQGGVTMRELFDRPTVQALAATLAKDDAVARRAELLVKLSAV